MCRRFLIWPEAGQAKANKHLIAHQKDLKAAYQTIENILAKTKISHGKRVFCKSEDIKKKITLIDLNKGFDMYLKNEDIKSIIFDLGYSFTQIKDPRKGLSFQSGGNLNMKLGLNNFFLDFFPNIHYFLSL